MDSNLQDNIFDQINVWMERAEEMTMITYNLKNDIYQTLGNVRSASGGRVCKILPSISIHSSNVYCNGIIIPIARMTTPLSLFRIFLRSPFEAFTREQLVEGVYGHIAPKLRTDRLTGAMNQNIIKLISRTRLIAEEAVNVGPAKWIEWFPYDADRNLWSFYRLTNAYLFEKQKSFMDINSSSGNA